MGRNTEVQREIGEVTYLSGKMVGNAEVDGEIGENTEVLGKR